MLTSIFDASHPNQFCGDPLKTYLSQQGCTILCMLVKGNYIFTSVWPLILLLSFEEVSLQNRIFLQKVFKHWILLNRAGKLMESHQIHFDHRTISWCSARHCLLSTRNFAICLNLLLGVSCYFTIPLPFRSACLHSPFISISN